MNWGAGDLAKEWKRFKQHCQFTFDGPLSEKTEKAKVNYLMTYVGDKGREVYETFDWTPAAEGQAREQDTLEGVYAKFAHHVAPKTNRIRATVEFNRRKQGENEKFDNFVTDLKILVKDCGYLEDDRMVRDCIVLRSYNETVQEKCIDQGDTLTLAKAIEIGQNYEVQQDSMKAIKGEDSKVHAISSQRKKARPTNKSKQASYGSNRESRNNNRKSTSTDRYKPQRRDKTPRRDDARSQKCMKCGYGKHKRHETCPAQNERCSYCHGRNHFASVCFKKSSAHHVDEYESDVSDNYYDQRSVYDSQSESDDQYTQSVHHTDLISAMGKTDGEWFEAVQIEHKDVQIQIDTGTKESIMPTSVFQSLNCKKKLQKTHHQFKSYSNHPLQIQGKIRLATKYNDQCVDIDYYVVEADRKPVLLSGRASKALGLISRVHNIDKYPELKTTTGLLPGTYSLKTDPTVKPVVHGPRKLPHALAQRVKDKLREMEKDGHIKKVTEPTDWVNSMCTVLKGDKLRICLDPKDLNNAIRREHYPTPTVEEIVASMPGANTFSVIDAKSGFLQVKLDYESSLLTTFNSCLGRFRWLRLPFGIKSAPEIYQRIMDDMLHDIEGARAIMDDIIVAGRSEEEHDQIMRKVVERATEWNLKLNFNKCQIKQKHVKYVGHVFTAQGLQPDPEKVRAVKDLPTPTSKGDVKRFLGMIQYLSKFVPNLSEIDGPLRDVVKKNCQFHWDKPQARSFRHLKDLCTKHPVLAYYDVHKEVTIQCDASSYALGGVLLQEGKPIAYTSCALKAAEKNYAQIEKEMLAIVHSCTKFHQYIFGKPVKVQTDHKPLQAIFSKPLLAAPMRLQSMLLKLQPYDLHVQYVPGTEIPIGDALSRANLPNTEPDEEPIMVNMVDFVAVTPTRYQDFQTRTADELNELHTIILKGWPDTKSDTPHAVREYWPYRDELAVYDGLVYKGMRIVVPPSVRSDMLKQIHESHLGINKCKQRARETLFWPGMSQQVQNMVEDCPTCNTYQNQQHKEPMKPSKIPDLPWSEVGSDIFDWKGDSYLLTVDYYSKFIEVDKLTDQSSNTTIEVLKSQISRHGIPVVLRSDNGPQFSSSEFDNFCRDYQIQHKTSSPHFPQSNGEAERAVQTVKKMWKKCSDKQLALLDYRTTPLPSCDLSPAQLLMGRRPRNKLPASKKLLQPKPYNPEEVKKRFAKAKANQQYYYDKKAGDYLPSLQPGDPVRMSPFTRSDKWLPATVVDLHSPRSYIIEHNGRKYRRNRQHLRLATYKANKDPNYHNRPNIRSNTHTANKDPNHHNAAPKSQTKHTYAAREPPKVPSAQPPSSSAPPVASRRQPPPMPTEERRPEAQTPPDLPSLVTQPAAETVQRSPRRNRRSDSATEQSPPVYVTRSGRRSVPPKRLDV